MKKFEIIEKYLNNQLKGDELMSFKKSLHADTKLAEDLRLYQSINKSLSDTAKNKLYVTLNEIHLQNQSTGIIRYINHYKVSAVAAAITILSAVGVLLVTMFNNPTNDQLYAAYFQPEQSVLSVRSAGVNMEQTIIQGMQLYEMKQFGAAVEMFNLAPSNLLGKLYAGIALMEINNFEMAIDNFNLIIEHNDNLFIDQAEWYLGLCYVKTNQVDQARQILNKIIVENTKYKKESLALLNKLDKRN